MMPTARLCCALRCASPVTTPSPRMLCRRPCFARGRSPRSLSKATNRLARGSLRWFATSIDDRRSARHAREILTDNLPDSGTPDGADALLDSWVLSDALASLSLEHRTAVVSAYYLGLSVAEIARRNDLPEGTVKSRLHYALRAMRIALQERGVTQ
jgi:DNA-binding NarL/FixJ family response regulator